MATSQVQNLPTILLVQGAFQTPQVYEKLVQGLIAIGYPTVHPQLPSCSDTENPDFPERSLTDDAIAIRAMLIRLIEYGGETVIVVMHSYGGLVGSEAIPEELTIDERRAKGLPGGVIHLFFYAAILLKEGQSVLSAFGESPYNDVRPDGRCYLKDGTEDPYHDLPPAEASLWASRLIAQSCQVQTTILTRAAWRYVPSTYLICENDQAVAPEYQEMFAASAISRVERCDSGHSPHLSQPAMLIVKIHEAAERAIFEQGYGFWR